MDHLPRAIIALGLALGALAMTACGLATGRTGGGLHGSNHPTDLVQSAFPPKEPAPGRSGGSASGRLWQDNASQSVALTDDLAAYQASPAAPLPFETFEYSRRNQALSASAPGPLRASEQWPEPARPQQRRFPFRYWKYE